ncbi:oligosaccharide flippase family protein [Sulfitobacter pontiacus]|uniref:oligosaccharide flippase family protein n=1 Tax=Sulfitobacter pontiacus TaxID=60137 RepID=UPI0015DFD922|nr:oligosaccharide flippase family protein [Sulfitobacter pontiacus]QLL44316.1 oligosaccharide flippase family protein [Sulfitobacter pontiacus]
MKGIGLRRLSLDIALTFGRQFFAGLLQLGIILFISRLLGPEGAGTYAVALLLPTLLSQLLNLGLASANVYFVASKQFALTRVWTASRDLVLGMSILGLMIGSVTIIFAGNILFPGIDSRLLFLAMLIFPTSLMTGVLTSLYQGLQNFRAYNLLVLIQPTVALFMMVCLWATSTFSLSTVLIATAAAHAVSMATGLVMMGKSVAVLARSIDTRGYLRPALRYGIKVHLGNVVAFLNYRMDIFLVNLFVGPAGAGLYSIAVRLVEQLWIISQAVSTVLLPRLAAMMGNDAGRRVLTPVMARFVLWGTMLAAGMLAAVATPLIEGLFGAKFRGATPALMILLPGVVMISCGRVLANDLAARGLVGVNLALAIGVLVVNLIGNLLLIPEYGILGAALATTIAYMANFLVRLILQNRLSGTIWWHVLIPMADDFKRIKSILKRKSIG